MTTALTIPWPLKSTEEAAILKRCEALLVNVPDEVTFEIDCNDVPYPSTRFLTLLMDIAGLTPLDSVVWTLLNAQASIAEALWLTGLDRWFSVSRSMEETL